MSRLLGRSVLALLLLWLAATPVAAQRPLSASLLRRLAAAADGYRTGDSVYVVAAYEFPHDVLGIFQSLEEADRTQVRAGTGYGRFGPFVTPQDLDLDVPFAPIRHCRPSIVCWPMPETGWFARDIDSLAVVAYHRSGTTWRSVSPGLEVDAIFFTLHSFDIFAVPYYTVLYGPGRAAALRDSLAARVRVGSPR